MGILRKLLLHCSAHHKIRQSFERGGVTITRIQRFNGFLDLGSISEALTSMAYTVSVVTQDGRKSDRFCVVRYLPMLGFVHGVEIWPDESEIT